MVTGLRMAHSGWRYVVLVLLLIVIVKYLIGWLGKGKWSNLDAMLNRFTPIVVEIQWVLGLIVYFLNGNFSMRSLEHPIIMTVAVAVMSILAARAKRATEDASKFQLAFIGYLVTALIIALGIYMQLGSFNLFGSLY